MARRRHNRTHIRNLAEYIGARQDHLIQVWHTTCPRHRDRQVSLLLFLAPHGRATLHCVAGCRERDILKAYRLPAAADKNRGQAALSRALRSLQEKGLIEVVGDRVARLRHVNGAASRTPTITPKTPVALIGGLTHAEELPRAEDKRPTERCRIDGCGVRASAGIDLCPEHVAAMQQLVSLAASGAEDPLSERPARRH